jgi:hypothetical protein
VRLPSQHCGLGTVVLSPADSDVALGRRDRLGLTRLPEHSGRHQRHLWSEYERDKGNENLVYPSPTDFRRSLTCRKILRHGTSGFISYPKEGVLRIFIALKNTSPWLGLNSQTLSSVASTLTTTPPRRHRMYVLIALRHC